MKLIAHRGNLNGKNPFYENSPKYCQEAIDKGFDVEIDIWYTDTWWTGHHRPSYRVDTDFLKMKEVWCHAKNIEALKRLLDLGAHCFFHQNDPVTLTSKGFMWTYPTHPLTENSICVLPELQKIDTKGCAGICSDFLIDFSTKK